MSDHLFKNPVLHPRTWGLHAHLLKDHTRDYRAVCREILRASDAIRAWTKDVCEGSMPVGPGGTNTSTGAVEPVLAEAGTLLASTCSRTCV